MITARRTVHGVSRMRRLGLEDPLGTRKPDRTGWLWITLTLLLAAVVGARPTAAFDLWWQLKAGELIWTTGHVPHYDVFSYTSAGQPWQLQEWLAEWLFYGLFHRVGADALVVYKVLGTTLVIGLVLWRCRLRCRNWALAAAVSALAALTTGMWLDVRPQLLSYVFFAFALVLLEQWRRGTWPRAIWLLPALMLLWVNVHGGFMVLFALLGVEIVVAVGEEATGSRTERRSARLLVVALLCALCALINPSGTEVYRYPFLLLGHRDMLNFIQEWLSPDFQQAWAKPLGFWIVLLSFCVGGTRRDRARDLLLLAGLLHSALFSRRHIPLLIIASAPMLAEHMGERLRGLQRGMFVRPGLHRIQRTVIPVALFLLLTGCLAQQAKEARLLAALSSSLRGEPKGSWFSRCVGLGSFPIYAAEFLARQPAGGRLFNDYAWGGYCAWRLWPQYHVFIDGRAEVYFATSYWDYQRITRLEPGWQEKLRRWGVDTILVPPGVALAGALVGNPAWRLIYEDRHAVVYRRTDSLAGLKDLPRGRPEREVKVKV
jgi:hypothetical protein